MPTQSKTPVKFMCKLKMECLFYHTMKIHDYEERISTAILFSSGSNTERIFKA